MKKVCRLIGTMLLSLTLLFSCMSPICVQAASNTKVAKNQKQLEKLLTDKNAKVIEISTSKKITITIPKGSFNKKIVINAPKASVINNGKMNGITVNGLSQYTENTKGNTLNVKDSKLTLNVSDTAELKSVTVSNKKADIKIVADGNVKKVTVNSAKSVDIQGDHAKPINVNSNAKGATIKANSSINVTMNKDGNLVVNVEQVKVIAGKDDVVTKITNNTEITIVIVDKNDDVVGEVESDGTLDVKNDNKSDKDKDTDKKDDKDKDKDKDKDNNISGSTTGGGGGSPIVVPPVVNNYSITITSSPAIIYANSVGEIDYVLKNNSTTLTSVPSSYSINTVTSGCSVVATSFGAIAVSAGAISGNAELRIELMDGSSNVVTSGTAIFTVETPEPPTPPFSLSELNNGYQMNFTYWDNANLFNTYKGHKHYVYLSSVEDAETKLESADWQVASVNNNENQNDESLVWTDLSGETAISGVVDSKYYPNAYKLSFNNTGKYYLRAKYNDHYVYSTLINVTDMSESTEFEDVEFDGQTYNVHRFQDTRNVVAFYVVNYAPEEIAELFSGVRYIKYQDLESSYRGLWTSYDRVDLSSYCIVYYTYNQEARYHLDGQIFGQTFYGVQNKPIKTESFENGILTRRTITEYDELGRTYTVKTMYYNSSGNVTSISGYYYTYDEDGNQTFHDGFPDES